MHEVYFNVFKEDISGYKGTDRPDLESPRYDPGDVPGECHAVLLSKKAVLADWAVHVGRDKKRRHCPYNQISSLLESSHIWGPELVIWKD